MSKLVFLLAAGTFIAFYAGFAGLLVVVFDGNTEVMRNVGGCMGVAVVGGCLTAIAEWVGVPV